MAGQEEVWTLLTDWVAGDRYVVERESIVEQ
jgi:hypothetical protein